MPCEAEELLLRPQHLSIYQVSRELKKENQSLWNCVQSVLSDAAFVEALRGLWPGVPQLANLRCGSWYTKEADGTCYFKSTDGHNGNWSFSPTRLNWHVAELAAQRGGAIIVDATRNVHKGGFPDALTKTIPIWAAVINRAVARARSNVASLESNAGWDTSLHLPLWVSSNEAKQIEGRLDAWVAVLLSVGADIKGLSKVLKKPLRPLWVSQASKIWVDMVAQPEDLPFTPLILVSASHPTMHGRRQCVSHPCPQSASPVHASPIVQPLQQHLQQHQHQHQQQQQQQQQHFPRHTCVADSFGFAQPEQYGCAATGASRQGSEAGAQSAGKEEVSTSYLHVPGSGDDEESWALGLTPALMWEHAQALTAAGPQGIEELVQQLLAANTQATAVATPMHNSAHQSADLEPNGAHAAGGDARGLPGSKVAKALLLGPVRTDAHHLRPQGCATKSGFSAHQVMNLGQGIFLLNELGVAVGGFEAGAPPGVWSCVDAVLNVGVREHAGMHANAEADPNKRNTPPQLQANGLGAEAYSQKSRLDFAGGAHTAAGENEVCDAGQQRQPIAGSSVDGRKQRHEKNECTACADGGDADGSKVCALPVAGDSRAALGGEKWRSLVLPGHVMCSPQEICAHQGGVLAEGVQESGNHCVHDLHMVDGHSEQQQEQLQRGVQGGWRTLHACIRGQAGVRGCGCLREAGDSGMCEGRCVEGRCCGRESIAGTCQHESIPSACHNHDSCQQQPQPHHRHGCSFERAHGPSASADTADAAAGSAAVLQDHSCRPPNANSTQLEQQQQQHSQPLRNSSSSSSSSNYLWLPVAPAKLSRFGLSEALTPALQFLSHHLFMGRRVLVHDDQGVDQSVCVVLALLLACYDWGSPKSTTYADGSNAGRDDEGTFNVRSISCVSCSPHGASSQPQQTNKNSVSAPHRERQSPGPCQGASDVDGSLQEQDGKKGAPKWRQPFTCNPVSGAVATPEAVSKHAVRQRLAFLAACYPQARPTRGMLKQVYNFFEAHKPQ